MTDYDPWDHLDDEQRNEWEIRQHLYAQRRLAELEREGRRSGRALLVDTATSTRCCRKGCNRTDVRLIRLTGEVVCPTHDPLASFYWGEPCRACGWKED